MKSIILSEDEILCIQSFMQEASNIPMIESIYLVPFLDEKTKQGHVEVVAIKNLSLYYNGKLTGIQTMRDTETEYNNLESTMEKFKEQFKDSRLSFTVEKDRDYSLLLMHNREIYTTTSLVNGIILFDRFGDKEMLKQKVSGRLPIYPNALQIENIEQITNNTKGNQVLKKTK